MSEPEKNEEWRKLQPVEMDLYCPKCHQKHLDIGEFATRVHRKHLCQNTPNGETGCGHKWMPAEYPTKGIVSLLPDAGHPHLINGEFQSDKYPTCPRGKVPLSVKDTMAQDLLWEYAQRRRGVDREFATDLELALVKAGYVEEPKLMERLCQARSAGRGLSLSHEELSSLIRAIHERRI